MNRHTAGDVMRQYANTIIRLINTSGTEGGGVYDGICKGWCEDGFEGSCKDGF